MITEQIEQLLQDDERALSAAKKRLERSPIGSIHVKHRNGSALFYRELPKESNGKRRELHVSKQNKRLITSLSTKRYCLKLLPVLDKEIALLKNFLNEFDPSAKHRVFQDLPKELSVFVTPLPKTNEQYISEWESERFNANPYPMDHDSYLTKKGEYVRSRLELITANMLFDLKIPYRYECALFLEDGSLSYPDFTILHPQTLELYWLELFGMMDDPDYASAALQKIARYARSEIFPKLIMVFDHKNAPFSTEALLNILQSTFIR